MQSEYRSIIHKKREEKILIVAPFYYPEGTAAAHRLTILSENLAKYSSVDVICYGNKVLPEKRKNNINILYWKGYLNVKKFFKYPFDIIKLILFAIRRKYRWVIISTPPHIPSLISTIVLSKFFKVIVDFRDTAFEEIALIKKGTPRYYLGKFSLILEKIVLRNKTLKILAVTKMMADFMKKKHKIRKNIFILNNGVDKEMINNKKKKKIYDIIFIGYFGKYRMPEKFFEILKIVKKKIKNIKVLLIIGNKKQYQNIGINFEYLIKYYKMENNVKILPFMSWSKLKEILPLAKIGYMAIPDDERFHLTVGTKVFDYIAAGLPVVLFANPDKHKEIYNVVGNAGLYGKNTETVAKNILSLIENKNIYKKVKKEVLKKQKSLLFEKNINKFLKFIKI